MLKIAPTLIFTAAITVTFISGGPAYAVESKKPPSSCAVIHTLMTHMNNQMLLYSGTASAARLNAYVDQGLKVAKNKNFRDTFINLRKVIGMTDESLINMGISTLDTMAQFNLDKKRIC